MGSLSRGFFKLKMQKGLLFRRFHNLKIIKGLFEEKKPALVVSEVYAATGFNFQINKTNSIIEWMNLSWNNNSFFIFGITNPFFIFGFTNLQINAPNVWIRQPYFTFGLTNPSE